MKKLALFSVLLLVLVLQISPVSAEDAKPSAWQLDTYHSTVAFTVRHLGISKVKGSFGTFTGTVTTADPDGKLSAFEGSVTIDAIDTGIEKRDAHLKAPDFFDAAKFPKGTLKSKSITWDGDKITVLAALTLKGVTKDITLTGEYLGKQKANFGQGDQLRAGYSLEGKINRQDFGLNFNKLVEGVSIVSDEITIQIDVEIYRVL